MSLFFLILALWIGAIAFYFITNKSNFGLILVFFMTSIFSYSAGSFLFNTGYKIVVLIIFFLLCALLVIAMLKLTCKLGDIKSNVNLLIVTLSLLVPLFLLLGFTYIKHNVIPTSVPSSSVSNQATNITTSDSISMSDVMANENRAKEDIITLLTMHDEVSYQKAKYDMTYSQDIADVYFSSDSWTTYVDYIGKPTVTFQSFGVGITDSNKLSYYGIVKSEYTRRNKKTETSVYMITTEYQNGVLTKFTKRVMR